jgi:hypothetical protein
VFLPFLQPAMPAPAEEQLAATDATADEQGAQNGAPTAVTAETPDSTPVAVESSRPASDLSPLPDALLQPSAAAAIEPANPTAASVPAAAPTETEPAPEASVAAPVAVDGVAEAPTPLVVAFRALREVVEGATGPEKQFAGAASVKTRLTRLLGEFDERTLGFSKFKDFLLAAEREGYVRVESSGPATRVRLP